MDLIALVVGSLADWKNIAGFEAAALTAFVGKLKKWKDVGQKVILEEGENPVEKDEFEEQLRVEEAKNSAAQARDRLKMEDRALNGAVLRALKEYKHWREVADNIGWKNTVGIMEGDTESARALVLFDQQDELNMREVNAAKVGVVAYTSHSDLAHSVNQYQEQ